MNTIKCNYAIQLNNNLEPIYVAKNGETLLVETINAYGKNFTNLSELMDLIGNKYGDTHHHPLTGPIDIESAKPGDVLKIEIQKINIDIMGQALSQSAGINPIKISNFGERAPVIAFREEEKIYYMGGIHIPYRPMLGMIGLAPSNGFIKTGHAGHTGGNLDIPFINQGCTIYLPIESYGGKLFLGDAHGAQGYGELGGIALEASAKVQIKLEILKPRYSFPSMIVIGTEPTSGKMGLGIIGVASSFQNLNEAVFDAYQNTISILKPLFPNLNEHYICNFITAIGHSMNGQAFSKTSESTSIINFFEEDLKYVMKSNHFSLLHDFDSIWFHY